MTSNTEENNGTKGHHHECMSEWETTAAHRKENITMDVSQWNFIPSNQDVAWCSQFWFQLTDHMAWYGVSEFRKDAGKVAQCWYSRARNQNLVATSCLLKFQRDETTYFFSRKMLAKALSFNHEYDWDSARWVDGWTSQIDLDRPTTPTVLLFSHSFLWLFSPTLILFFFCCLCVRACSQSIIHLE